MEAPKVKVKDKAEKRHDRGVEHLVDRLMSKGYDAVLMHPQYKGCLGYGEVDVLAFRGDYVHWYEYKTTFNRETIHKARKQYRRMQQSFPNFSTKGIYVTENGTVRRLS